MNMMFSKEGAVRFSFVVVAESAALIPLYTLLVPLKNSVNFLRFWNSGEFVAESDCYFGFEEFLLLLSGRHT
jgi:hypothetical protein